MYRKIFTSSLIIACGLNMSTSFGQSLDSPPIEKKVFRSQSVNVDSFYSASLQETSTGVPVRDISGNILIKGLIPSDWCKLSALGSGIVRRIDGSIATVNFYNSNGPESTECKSFYPNGSVSNRATFFISKSRFGEGSTGYHLIPFRSVSTNNDVFPIGSVIYIPSIRGQKYKGDSGTQEVHDGYFFVADSTPHSGSAFLSIFTGTSSANPFPQILSNEVRFGSKSLLVKLVYDPEKIVKLSGLHNPEKRIGIGRINYFDRSNPIVSSLGLGRDSVKFSAASGDMQIALSKDNNDLSIQGQVIRVNIIKADAKSRFSLILSPEASKKMGIVLNESTMLSIYKAPPGLKWFSSRDDNLNYKIDFSAEETIYNKEIAIEFYDRLAYGNEMGGSGGVQDYPDPHYPFYAKFETTLRAKNGIDLDALARRLGWNYNESPIDAIVSGKLGYRPIYRVSVSDRGAYNNFPLLNHALEKGYCVKNGLVTRNYSVISLNNGSDYDTHGVHADFMGAGSDNCYPSFTGRLHEGADIRAYFGTKVYSIFDAQSVSVLYDLATGRYLRTKLGTYVAKNGIAYDIIFRYLHLNSCDKIGSSMLNAGDLLGTTAAGAYAGVQKYSQLYRQIQNSRNKISSSCKIDYDSHLHIDVIIEPQNKKSDDKSINPFHVDPILFIKYIKDYNDFQRKTTINNVDKDGKTPVFKSWTFTECKNRISSPVSLVMGRGDLCSIKVILDENSNNASLVSGIFSYELIYKEQGKNLLLSVPGSDLWNINASQSSIKVEIQNDYYNFQIPLFVNYRPNRIYQSLRVIGKLYFDNGALKTIIEDLPLIHP